MSQALPRGGQRWRYLVAVTVCLVLLGLIQVAAPHANLNIVWRYLAVSFDSPATQILDELALETTSFADPIDELLALSQLLARSARAALPAADDGAKPSEILSARISRSPPLA